MSSADEIQSIVCDIIREYLKKKPFFSIEDIVTFVNNRVRTNPNINRNRIELIIKDLIRKRILIPGTKLMKNNIIEHPIRNEIYDHRNKSDQYNTANSSAHELTRQIFFHVSHIHPVLFLVLLR